MSSEITGAGSHGFIPDAPFPKDPVGILDDGNRKQVIDVGNAINQAINPRRDPPLKQTDRRDKHQHPDHVHRLFGDAFTFG